MTTTTKRCPVCDGPLPKQEQARRLSHGGVLVCDSADCEARADEVVRVITTTWTRSENNRWTAEINGLEYEVRYQAPAGRPSAGGGTYAVECGPDHVGHGYASRHEAEAAAERHAAEGR